MNTTNESQTLRPLTKGGDFKVKDVVEGEDLCRCDACRNELQLDIAIIRRCFRAVYEDKKVDSSLYDYVESRMWHAHGQRCAVMKFCLHLLRPNVAQMNYVQSFMERVLPTLNVNVGLNADTKGVAEAFTEAVKGLPSDIRKNTDGAFPAFMGFDKIFDFVKDPTTMRAGCAIVFAILAILNFKYPTNSAVRVISIIFAMIGVHYLASETIMNMVMSWFAPAAQSWTDVVPIITEGISLGFFSSKLNFSGLEDFAKSLKQADDHSKSIGSYIDKVKDWVIRLIAFVCDTFGVQCSLLYGKHDAYIKDVGVFMLAMKERFEMKTFQSKHYTEAQVLRSKGSNILIQLPPTTSNQLVRKLIQDCIGRLDFVVSQFETFGINVRTRIEPAKLWLCGASGVGKSAVARAFEYKLAPFALNRSQLADYEAKREMYIYRKPQDKFWEGYQQGVHVICSFNDALTKKESDTACFAAQFMDLDSPSAFSLPMAFEGKGKTFFDSRAIVITSNVTCLNEAVLSQINNVDAFRRRFPSRISYVVTVKKEYRSEKVGERSKIITKEADPEFRNGIDREKVDLMAKDDETKYWNFYPVDLKTSKLVSDVPLSFEEVLDIVREDMRANEKRAANFDVTAQSLVSDAVKARMQELDDEEREEQARAQILKERAAAEIANRLRLEPVGAAQVRSFAADGTELKQPNARQEPFFPWTVPEGHGAVHHFDARSKHMQTLIMHIHKRARARRAGVDFEPEAGDAERDEEIGRRPELIELAMQFTEAEWVRLIATNVTDEQMMRVIAKRLDRQIVGDDLATLLWDLHLEKYMCMAAYVQRCLLQPLRWACSFLPEWISYDVVLEGLKFSANFIITYKLMSWFLSSVAPSSKRPGSQVVLDDEAQSVVSNPSDRAAAIKVMKNTFQINIPEQDGVVASPSLCTALFVGGHTAITTRHTMRMLLETVKERPNLKISFSSWAARGTTVFNCFVKNLRILDTFEDKDVVFFQIPNHTSRFPNILHMFLSKESDGMKYILKGGHIDIAFCRYIDELNILDIGKAKHKPLHRYLFAHDKSVVEIKDAMSINIETKAGECGQYAFWVGDDRKYHDKSNVPSITYIHTSSDGRNGCGSIINREMVESALVYFNDNVMISHPVDRLNKGLAIIAEEFGVADVAHMQLTIADPYLNDDPPLAVHHPPLAYTDEVPAPFTKNPVVRSPLYGMLSEVEGGQLTRKPAKLRPYVDKEGRSRNPMAEARQAYGLNPTACVCNDAMSIIENLYVSDMMSHSSIVRDPPVLSFEEALLGSSVNEGVDINSSVGFDLQYILKHVGASTNGKRGILREDFATRTEHENYVKFKAACDRLHAEFLERGDRHPNKFKDCLKAELRGLDKDTTRMFSIADFPYLLQCKRYFGSFANWIMDNRLCGTSNAIGINPHSEEWQGFFEYLTEHSMCGLFADFGKYDKKLLAILIHGTQTAYKKFYGTHDPEANSIRDLLFEDMVESLHVTWVGNRCYLYNWMLGNSSGNFLTAIINGIANDNLHTYCAVDILGKGIHSLRADQVLYYAKFFKGRSNLAVYGDDAALGTSIEELTFPAMQDSIMRNFGLEYTDDTKSSESADFKQVVDGSFIGRGFISHDIGGKSRVMGKLRLPSILEAAQYYRNIPSEENLKLVVENSLLELSIHGKETFDKFAPHIARASLERLSYSPLFADWKQALTHVACRSKEEIMLSYRNRSIAERSHQIFGQGLSPDL